MKEDTNLVHFWIHVLELLDGGVGGAVALLYMLLQVVLPSALEPADRTGERGGLEKYSCLLYVLYV